MTTPNPETAVSSRASRSFWLPTLVVTTVAAGFGVYQVLVFFERSFPAFYWSRTIAALVSVAIAAAGPLIPLLRIVRRAAFMRLPAAGQSAALVLLPVGYIAAFGLLLDLARRSYPIFSTTQTMNLRHAPGDDPPLDLRVPGGMSGHGRGHGENCEWVAEWEYWWLPDTLRDPDIPPDLQVTCTGSSSADELGELMVEIACNREIVFDLDRFAEVNATQNGGTVSFPLLFEPGSHSIIINARAN